jgi:hypothetical protein
MQSQPTRAIPPSQQLDPIAPDQVWRHLDVNQQQQICKTLILIIEPVLTQTDSISASEGYQHDNTVSQQ